MHHILNGVGSFFVLFFCFGLRCFTVVFVTIVHCNFILNVEVGLCNQTNVSNNKRRMVPLGPFPPQKTY